MHVGIANPRWRGKRSRHSRRMRNPQFYISAKRPIVIIGLSVQSVRLCTRWYLTINGTSLVIAVCMFCNKKQPTYNLRQNEENQQTKIWSVPRIHQYVKFQGIRSKKIPGNPKFDLFHSFKMAPEWGISTDCDQNLICSEDYQNTSTCLIWDHSSLVFSWKYLKIANLACFTKRKCHQNEEY